MSSVNRSDVFPSFGNTVLQCISFELLQGDVEKAWRQDATTLANSDSYFDVKCYANLAILVSIIIEKSSHGAIVKEYKKSGVFK